MSDYGYPAPDCAPRRYAQVAIDRPFAQALTYSIAPALDSDLHIGSLVEVPLQRQSVNGVVVAISGTTEFKGRIRPVTRALTPDYSIDPDLMELGRWIADYYCCALGEALAAVSFIGLNDVHAKTKTLLQLTAPDHWLAVSREVGPEGKKVTPKQGRVIRALLAVGNDPAPPSGLRADAGVGDGVLQTMIDRGWLSRVAEPVMREDEYAAATGEPDPAPELTADQRIAFDAIDEPLQGSRYGAFLLHGVTGSGKTEIYLRVIENGLRLGRTALVLVPEIALTPQTVHAFRSRLGNQVGVYHSRLTLGQKHDLWRKIHAGEVRVVIGARSAVFSPLPNLGVVVVDEEHETAFKQGETPRYHARDVAIWRASRRGAVAILGSATPSMESTHNVREGKYQRLELPERIGPHASPVMTVVDMRRHVKRGQIGEGAALISPMLREAIEKRLAAGEQTILLLNRRGFANQVLCFACEKIVQCPHCDVSLTYHKTRGRLLCHWCGYRRALPNECPHCGKPELQTLGLGTQRIEEVLVELFPSARTLRIDVDSMRGRRNLLEAWRKITEGEVDIILGTQMIAKGIHLESVTLAGVISADFALFLPDFRSAERTYQLLTQLAGRAGRGDRPGEVILQSYMPHHYAIDAAARLDEKGFYEREMHMRRMLRFPPASRLIGILAAGKDVATVREQTGRLANMLKSLAMKPSFKGLKALGPAPAPIARLGDQHRWRILLRGPQPGSLHKLLHEGLVAFARVHQKTKVNLTIDVDPMDLL